MGRQQSKAYIIQELYKCSRDPVYFLETYGKVRHPKNGIVPFILFEYQKVAVRSFQKNRFNITLKSRQTGLSTITAGYIAWLMIFHTAKEVCVVADKQKNAQGFVRKIKLIIKNCPNWMTPRIVLDNQGSIQLSNGSRVSAEATTSNAGRSESLSLLVIDEAAAIDQSKVSSLWAAASPTLSLGGAAVIISTPKGIGNFYHQQWVAADTGESDFVPLRIHWTQHPEYAVDVSWHCQDCGHVQAKSSIYDPICDVCGKASLKPTSPWYKDACKNLGDPRLIAQEYDMNFLGSGENVIQEEYIAAAEKNVRKPLKIIGFDNKLWIWEDAESGEEYLISADVARGDGADFSAAHVIKQSNGEQVAEYCGQLPPNMYAEFLTELGKTYNNALLAVEANSIGYATCLKIVELKYPNIFYSTTKQFDNRDKQQFEKQMKNPEKMIPGFQTTSRTRPLAISELEESIRLGTLIIHSNRLINELRTFIYNNGKAEAMSGYHDDLCMSAAIGMSIKNVILKDIKTSKALAEAALVGIGVTGFQGTDTDYLHVANEGWANPAISRNEWTMVDSAGNAEDLSWLIK